MARPRFQVVLMQPAGYPHTGALAEAAEYLVAAVQEAGFRCGFAVNGIETACRNIILGAHLLPERQAGLLPADSIIFNTEPLDDPGGWHFASGAYGLLLERFWVWDYSRRNLGFIPHGRKAFIPFLFHRKLLRPKPPLGPPAASPLLVFYGTLTPWRREIIGRLNELEWQVEVLDGVYGAARDLVLFDSIAVLNLHQSRETRLFEPIRCFYPLINGIPVLSEDSPKDPTIEDFRESLFILPRGEEVVEIDHLLNQPLVFQVEAKRKLALFRRKRGQAAVKRAIEGLGA